MDDIPHHLVQQASSLGAKAPALGEATARAPSLMEHAGAIMDSLRALAESPSVPLENIGLGIGAVAAAMTAARAIQEIRKDRGEEGAKRAAEKSARQWAEADGSLVAYAQVRGQGLEGALGSATAEVNRFLSRSDPRAQAIDIALRMPIAERLEAAAGFDGALAAFARAIPRDAGISHNHAKLASMARTPVEAAATGERAAFGALERGDALTSGAREACFALMQASAARAVAIERGEWVSEQAPAKPKGRKESREEDAR